MKKIAWLLTLVAFVLASGLQITEAAPVKSKAAAHAKAKPGKKGKKGKKGGKKKGGKRGGKKK